MLFLRTFGALELENGDSPPTGAALHPSRLAILAAIASSGDLGISRDTLYALFWPESTVQRARGSLKQALFALRRDLDCDQLTTGRSVLRLNASVIGADVVDFVEACRRSDYRSAATLYRGEFLNGIRIRGSPEFDEWAEKQKSILAAEYRKCLEHLATSATSPKDAMLWWERLASADPYSASTTIGYMRALNDLGRREEAISYGALHIQRVKNDLDAAPEPHLVDFISKLKNGPAVMNSPRATTVDSSEISRSAPAPHKSVTNRRANAPIQKALWAAVVPVIAASAMIPLSAGLPPRSVRPPGEGIQVERFVLTPQNDPLLERYQNISEGLESNLKELGFTRLTDPLSSDGNDESKATARGSTVLGSVSHEGDSVVFRAAIKDGSTGPVITAIDPIIVSKKHLMEGREILWVEIRAALGKPYETSAFPLLSSLTAHPRDSAFSWYLSALGEAESKIIPLSVASLQFRAAYDADTLFPTALLADAFMYRSRDSLWVVTPLLARLNNQRRYLSPLNRIALSYLIYEANGDFDSKLRMALKASDLAPQSAWSLEAARLLIEAASLGESKKHLERFARGMNWQTPPKLVSDYWFLSIEAAHRDNDRAAEWTAIKQASLTNDTTLQVQYALARRLFLDTKYLEGNLALQRMLHAHRTEGYIQATRLEEDLQCHMGHVAIVALLSLSPFRDSVPDDAARARAEAYAAMERGSWWYASYRFRAVLDSFPGAANLEDSARAAYVESNMIDKEFGDNLIRTLYRRGAMQGDGSAEYWLSAALARRGRVKEAIPYMETARRKGLPVLRSGHSSSAELELLRLNHLVGDIPQCAQDQ